MTITDALTLAVLGLAVGGLSTTISKAHALDIPRAWIARHSKVLGELIHCPYCVSHWIAAAIVVAAPAKITGNAFVDYPAQGFSLVALGAFTVGMIMKLMLWDQAELEQAHRERDEAVATLREIANG
jgi:hypothetical protein